MRVNVSDEETTDRVEVVCKRIDGRPFIGLRVFSNFRQRLMAAVPRPVHPPPRRRRLSAVTFWTTDKRGLREMLTKAEDCLDSFDEAAARTNRCDPRPNSAST